jgi:hypothetical protein
VTCWVEPQGTPREERRRRNQLKKCLMKTMPATQVAGIFMTRIVREPPLALQRTPVEIVAGGPALPVVPSSTRTTAFRSLRNAAVATPSSGSAGRPCGALGSQSRYSARHTSRHSPTYSTYEDFRGNLRDSPLTIATRAGEATASARFQITRTDSEAGRPSARSGTCFGSRRQGHE